MVLLGVAITAAHDIEYYYVEPDTGRTNTMCVWARRSWTSDIKCYCSDDPSKVWEALARLKGEKK